MRSSSVNLQLQLADIILVLDNDKDIPIDMIEEYFNLAGRDITYVGFDNYRETALIKQITMYFSGMIADAKCTLDEAMVIFLNILDKIYTVCPTLENPRELHQKIFEYIMKRLGDQIIASAVLGEANDIVDRTNNIVLSVEIKQLLLDIYLRSPNRLRDEIRSTSSKLRELNANEISDKEIGAKSLL